MRAINGVIALGDTDMDYISFGRGTKPLVIIPGLGDGLATVKGKAHMGTTMFRELSEQYRVYMFSRKNGLEPDATIHSMARDQAEAMQKLGLANAHIVGVSQGGMIAQHLAAEFHTLVDKLVLVVTVPKTNELLKNNVELWMEQARQRDYRGLMIDITEKSHPERYAKKFRVFYPTLSLARGPKSYRRFLIQAEACLHHDATQVLRQIVAPTLVIGGERDETLGPEGSRELVDAIPNSYLCIYHDHGHGLYEDARDFNDRVIRFLNEGA